MVPTATPIEIAHHPSPSSLVGGNSLLLGHALCGMPLCHSPTLVADSASRCICHADVLIPELLSIIFQEVIAPEERELPPGEENFRANDFDTERLLTLSHVCQYWRDVALGVPALWTCIQGGCHDRMEAFLERSRPMTITLFLDVEHFGGDVNGPLHEYAASAVETHSQRLRRLDLSMVPTWEHVDPLLTSLQAPDLECLTITSSCLSNKCNDTELAWGPLNNGETSSLRALAMIPVVNWMPSCTFPHLTHLFISFDGETALCHPFDVLRLLSNAPTLTFLYVDFLVGNVPCRGDWQPPSDPIPLCHLRSLVFTACWYNLMHAIVSHLSLPEDVFIRLQNIIDYDSDSVPLPPLDLRPVTSLDIATQADEILMVADGPTSGLWFSGHYDRDHVVQRENWIPWLQALPGSLALSHVTHLHINVDFEDELFIFWPAFLAHLPQVSHLAVLIGTSSDPPQSNYAPTTVLSDALAPRQARPVLCPVLDTLTVEWAEAMTEYEVGSYSEFPKMLGARARAGHPIRRVVMQTMLDRRFSKSQALDFVQQLRRATEGYEAEYELVVKEETGEGLCAYEMRDVWRVDGEERYWEVGDEEKPRYVLPEDIGGYSWTGIWMW